MRTSTTTPRKSCRSHAAPDPRRRCSTRHPPRPICIRRLIPPLDEWIHRAARNSLYRLSGSQCEESVGTARAPEKKTRPVRVKERTAAKRQNQARYQAPALPCSLCSRLRRDSRLLLAGPWAHSLLRRIRAHPHRANGTHLPQWRKNGRKHLRHSRAE